MDSLAENPSNLSTSPSLKSSQTVYPRLSQYKARDSMPDQEERRRHLLEEQKAKRRELFNENRGLIEEVVALAEENDMEWSEIQAKRKQHNVYKNLLMFSEWLLNIPEDFEQLWYMVPCPVGRRTLIVATAGKTRAYSKSGYQMAVFQSLLPGGNHNDCRGCTILDCIWSFKNHTYYVLDVLAWNNQQLSDCETEFRFYWLKSKMEETSCFSNHASDNAYPFMSLEYYKSDTLTMMNVMSVESLFGCDGPKLDGLLFYHSQAHYIPGVTPLVGWLKPHMMPATLGVSVAPLYLQEDMEISKKRKCRKSGKHHTESQTESRLPDADSSTEMETTDLHSVKEQGVEEEIHITRDIS
ncbi:snurportin-1-like [Periplaneta americana]|uniref:snurportin-1-like n=1 Tax=Periplaneta americana TaxID=6978 RepID=UPI0037E8EEC1